jgi:hypothetical protein
LTAAAWEISTLAPPVAVSRKPQAIAVSDGAVEISYAELDRRSDQGAAPQAAVGEPSDRSSSTL